MEIISLQAQPKSVAGKEEAKRIRRAGMVPCVMYKSGGGDAVQFSLNPADFRHLVYTPDFKLAEINVEGASHKCIVKEIQFHPVTEQVLHLDFLELVPGVKFRAEVPIRFEGSAPGVKAGGKFLAKLRNVRILTTPEKAVDSMSASISEMDLGSTIRVRDIKAVEGVEVINASAVPIASIEIPRALRGGKN